MFGPMFGPLLAGAGPATAPATQPTTAPAAASADERAVRDRLLAFTRDFPTDTLAQVRATLYDKTDAEQKYDDAVAHYVWRTNQTMKAVRDKFGPEAEGKFGHLVGMDTVEQDRAATIHVTGDHATVDYPDKALTADHFIRVDGQWLLDGPTYYADAVKNNSTTVDAGSVEAMHQAGLDVTAGKYADVAALIADVKDTLGSAPPDAPATQP